MLKKHKTLHNNAVQMLKRAVGVDVLTLLPMSILWICLIEIQQQLQMI